MSTLRPWAMPIFREMRLPGTSVNKGKKEGRGCRARQGSPYALYRPVERVPDATLLNASFHPNGLSLALRRWCERVASFRERSFL